MKTRAFLMTLLMMVAMMFAGLTHVQAAIVGVTVNSEGDAVVVPGVEFQTTVSLPDAVNVSSFQFVFYYDSTYFDVVSLVKSDALANPLTQNLNIDGEIHVNYSNIISPMSGDIALFDIVFVPIRPIPLEGVALLTTTPEDNEVVSYDEVSQELEVIEPVIYELNTVSGGVYGDVNGDHNVTIIDVALIQMYLASLKTLTPAQMVLADANDNGDISIIDVALIQMYLANLIDHIGPVPDPEVTTLFFEENGGTHVPDLIGLPGTPISEPEPPVLEGHGFAGWFADSDLTIHYVFDLMPEVDTTVYAGWVPDSVEYALTFLDADGTLLQETYYAPGTDLSGHVFPDTPSLDGQTFSHWSVTLPPFMPEVEFTLVAVYESTESYQLIFEDGFGGTIASETYPEGSDLTQVHYPQAPQIEGYGFVGWSGPIPDVMPSADVIINAIYDMYVWLNYDANGGTYELTMMEGTPGTPIYFEGVPEREGYNFIGWFEDADQTIPLSYEVLQETDTTIYAGWALITPDDVTLTFVTNVGDPIPSITAAPGTPISEPTLSWIEGYGFVGWFTDPDHTIFFEFDLMPETSMTVYAYWVLIEFRLAFEDADGTLLQETYYAPGADLSGHVFPETPSLNDEIFIGWTPELPPFMPEADLTLYALYDWQAHYAILYFLDDFSIIYESWHEPGEDLSGHVPPTDPVMEGYVFVGWDEVIPPVMPEGDIFLFPIWQQDIQTMSVSEAVMTSENMMVSVEGTVFEKSDNWFAMTDGAQHIVVYGDGRDLAIADQVSVQMMLFHENETVYGDAWHGGSVVVLGTEALEIIYEDLVPFDFTGFMDNAKPLTVTGGLFQDEGHYYLSDGLNHVLLSPTSEAIIDNLDAHIGMTLTASGVLYTREIFMDQPVWSLMVFDLSSLTYEEMTYTEKVNYVEASLQVYFSEILYPGDTMDVPLTSDVFGGTLTYTPVGTYASGLDVGGSTMMVNESLGSEPYIVDVEVTFALGGESTIFIIQIVVDDGTVTPIMMVIAEQLQDVTIMGEIMTVIDGSAVIADHNAYIYVDDTLAHESGDVVILRGSYLFDGSRHVLANITREDTAPTGLDIIPTGIPTSMSDLMALTPMSLEYSLHLMFATGIVTFDPDRPYPFMLEDEGGVLPIDTDGYHLWAELDLRIGMPTSITGPVRFIGGQIVIRPIDNPDRLMTPHMDDVELMTWIEEMVTMHEPIVLEANTYAPFPTVLQPLDVTIIYAVTSDPTDAFNTLTRRAGVVDADETVDVLMAVYHEGVWIGSLNLTVTVLAPTVLTVEQFYDAPLGMPVFVRADTYLRTNSLIMIQDATGFAYINTSSYSISMGQDVLLYGFKDEVNGFPVLSPDTAVATLYGDALGHSYDITPRTISDIIDLDPLLGSSYLMPHEVTGTVVVETEGMMRWFTLEHLDQRLSILTSWEGEQILMDLVGLEVSIDLYYTGHYADWVDETSMIYLAYGEGIDVRLANVNASEMAGLYASWIESTINVAYESGDVIPFDFAHPLYSGDVVWTHGNPDDSGYVDLISGTINAPDLTEPKTITLILEVTSVVDGVTQTHQATITFDIVPGMSVTLGEFLSGDPMWATFEATVVAFNEWTIMLSDNTGSIFMDLAAGMYFGLGDQLLVTGIRTIQDHRFFVADGYQVEPLGWTQPTADPAPEVTLDELNMLAFDDPYNYGLPVLLSGTVTLIESQFEGVLPALTDGVTTVKVIGDYGFIWDILNYEDYRLSIEGYLYDHQDGTWTLWAYGFAPDDYSDQEILDIFKAEIVEAYDRSVWFGGTAPTFPLLHDVFSGIAASYHGIGDFASLYNLGTLAFESINHEVHIRIEVMLETMTLTETFEILIDLQPPVPDTTIEDFLNWGIDGDRYKMIATVVQNTYDELILTDGTNILTMNAYNWTVGRGDTILVTGTRETVNGRIQLGPDSIVLTYVDHPGFDLPDPIFVPYQSVFMPDDSMFFYRYLTLKGRLVFNPGINSYQLVDGNQAITIRYQGNAGTFLSQNQGAIVTLDVTIYQFDDTFVVFYLGTGSDIMLIG